MDRARHWPLLATFVLMTGAGLLAAPALAADQFDLNCTGARQTSQGGPRSAVTYTLHIDLAAGRWCSGSCAATRPIVDVAPDRLVLARSSSESRTGDRVEENYVSRTDGAHSSTMQSLFRLPRGVPTVNFERIEGHCEAAPFTPFPAVKF